LALQIASQHCRLVIAIAAYVVMQKASSSSAHTPAVVSFENPMYDTQGGAGAYADPTYAVSSGGDGGASGYMDVGGTDAAANEGSGYMDVNPLYHDSAGQFGAGAGAGGGGVTGYMDVSPNAGGIDSDEEEV
jgi:hypothetical protein